MKVYNWNAAVDSVMIRIVGIFDMNYNTDVRWFANLIGIIIDSRGRRDWKRLARNT